MIANAGRGLASPRRDDWQEDSLQRAVGLMEFLYAEAVEAWRTSQKQTTAAGRSSCGEPRYLAAAARINIMNLEMQTRHRTRLALWRGRLDKLEQQIEQISRKNPPTRDCSPFRGDRRDSRRDAKPPIAVKDDNKATCGEAPAEVRVPRTTQNDSSATVHGAQPAAGSLEPLLDAEPAKRELFPKLNRQERKARQRQLEKLRRQKGR